MSEEFKTIAELQTYANSQHEIINKLNAKINALEESEKHLQKLLADNSIIVTEGAKDLFIQCEDPEAISRTQLKILRDRSLQQELTIEETKRVEIYTKILDGVEAKKKNQVKDVTGTASDEELLKLVANESGSNK